MKPTMEILTKLQENSKKNHDEVFTRLYRYLLRPDIYYVAYQHLYSNKGAGTKGVTDDTADGFSEIYIENIIEALKNEMYQPKPVRRTYIKKSNGKMRPLGLPVFTDKLIQEAIRMILEAIYEPIFSDYSHGFRPARSCHTALAQIKKEFTGARWFIEGDIKGCFDNINHAVLVEIINQKIKDARFLKLIRLFLKAGYMEDWKYHETYSGCPQGGIISPILANIYLNELDRHIMKIKKEFDVATKARYTPEYVFMVPVFVLYFLWLKKLGRTQSFLHTAAVFVFGYYLFGLLTVTGIGFTSTMTFRPNISWTPFIGMITGPIDTILNIILFVPLGFFLPLLYKKYHHMKTVALTGFLFSLAVEIVQMFGWGSSDINDLMTNTAGACIGFLVYCLLSRILPANLKKQLQSSRVNAVAEVLLFAICTFAIMVTAQTWFVHDVLNVP